MQWNERNPDNGAMILARFGPTTIECHAELDGFYTRNDQRLVDELDCPIEPDAWLPIHTTD